MNVPTRQSVYGTPPSSKVHPGHALLNGMAYVTHNGTNYHFNTNEAEGLKRFNDFANKVNTPQVQHMKRALATGHRWTVPGSAFENFMLHNPQHIADLAGASAGDYVEFDTQPHHGPHDFYVSMTGVGENKGAYSLRRVKPAHGVMLLDSLKAPSENRGRGWGARTLFRMVRAARKFGIQQLHMGTAAGSPASKFFNGYYTWPRLGFQGEIPEERRVKLPPHLRKFDNFHDLMDHPEGAAYWKDHGDEVYGLHFDVSPGSPHVQRLVKYLRSAQAARRSQGPSQLAREDSHSWLDPQGNFYPLKIVGGPWSMGGRELHEQWAEREQKASVDELMDRGWHRVTRHGNTIYTNNVYHPPTPHQKRALIDHAIEEKVREIIHDNQRFGRSNERPFWVNRGEE